MTSDAEARDIHATVTSSGQAQEPADDDRAQRPDVVEGEVIDPDAVIVEEVSPVTADDDSPVTADDDSPVTADDDSPVTADDDSPVTADDDSPVTADDEQDMDLVAAASAATIPETARPGMPADTDLPADTDMAGDPEQLHERWAAIQSTFVDDPRGSVVAAAELVSETIAALVASAEERERGLRREWEGDGVDTEGLRNALRGYRGLLDRLVAL